MRCDGSIARFGRQFLGRLGWAAAVGGLVGWLLPLSAVAATAIEGGGRSPCA